jgi:hypothetical protein
MVYNPDDSDEDYDLPSPPRGEGGKGGGVEGIEDSDLERSVF